VPSAFSFTRAGSAVNEVGVCPAGFSATKTGGSALLCCTVPLLRPGRIITPPGPIATGWYAPRPDVPAAGKEPAEKTEQEALRIFSDQTNRISHIAGVAKSRCSDLLAVS